MSFMNAELANVVQPYLSDVGVCLVFGLGYYVISYLYGENKPGKDKKNSPQTIWDSCKTLEEFNNLIKKSEEEGRINPFEVLDKIHKCSLIPDITIYNNLINACYVKNRLDEAEKLVEEVFDFASPVQADLFTFNILLKGISTKLENNKNGGEKETLVESANKIFQDIKEKYNISPNDVTINTQMDILIKGGHVSKAWDLFDAMRSKYSVEPDKYSYSTIIKALKYEPDLSKLDRTFGILELLKERKTSSTSSDEIIFNCLIDVCIILGKIDKAENVFKSIKELGISPTKATYAVMIRGYGQVFQLDKALDLYEELKTTGIEPTEVIYGCILNACVRSSNFKMVAKIYKEMQEKEVKMNIILYTTLIKAYSKQKNFQYALKVYEDLLSNQKIKPNIVVHNAMLDCCVECNCTHKMGEIYENIKSSFLDADEFSEVPKPDIITYSTVIKGYGKAKDIDKVMDIFYFLQNSSEFVLDEIIYNSVLDACAKSGSYEKAMKVYNQMCQKNMKMSNVTYSILVKIYSNNKEEDKAFQLLKEMKSKNIKPGIIVYTCLIQTCLKSKLIQQAIVLFEEMKNNKLKTDHVVYNTIVNGCIYGGKLEAACKFTIESFYDNVRMPDEMYTMVNN